MLKKFVEKPELVDSWKSLTDAGYNKEVYRNVAALELHNSCKIGRKLIPDVKVERIHLGSNDKVVILGSGMQNRIEPAAEVLRKEGFTVELFNDKCQTKPFIIDGEHCTFEKLNSDWMDKLRHYNNGEYVNYTDPGAKEFFESTKMYKANEQFIKRIIDEDYTIIHIGQTADSYFCDMENRLIETLKWIK